MSRLWQILILVFLLLSLVANVGLLWVYSRAAPDLQRLRQEMDQQSQELATLRQEKSGLDEQIQTLTADKARLEEENSRLQGELQPLQNSQDMLEQLDQLEADVRAVRRRIPPQPVARAFVTREDLRSYLEKEFAADNTQDQSAANAQVLVLLGLLPQGTDLYRLLLDLYTEQVAGFYDLKEGKMYLVSGEALGPLEKIAFVHEYVHAIQDQFFGLEGQVEAVQDDSDRSLALEGLAEGDAMLAMFQFTMDYPDVVSTSGLLSQSLAIDTPQFDAAPPVIQQMLLFPYTAGLQFVMPPYAKTGWAGVDGLWADPPQSTEQLLHPERYPDDAPKLVSIPRLEGTLGVGWHLADEDTLGEFMLRQHLALFLDSEQVDTAATGWGGDHYALYLNAQRNAAYLVIRIVWDDRAEADEFVGLYPTYAKARYGAEGEGNPQTGMWWNGSPGFYLEQTGSESWLIWAPERAAAEAVARALR
jgi:hypothetical protein